MKQRLLEESEVEGEASKLGYTPFVETHSSKEVKIGLVFDNPDVMAMGGASNLGMAIKEPSIFKSAKTMKSMSEDSFKGGKPELNGEVPPIVNDPKLAKSIDETADEGGEIV